MPSKHTRIEKDSLGEKEIPADALYGVQVARAVENFQISDEPIGWELITAYAELKKACAQTNAELGQLDQSLAKHIIKAADEIIEGKHDEHFVVDIYQAGAGTSTNMNLNEVIANRVLEMMGKEKGDYRGCSPNDHVNMAQSTNDTYPTAMRLAILMQLDDLYQKLAILQEAFEKKAKEFKEVIKSARTHLQDAVPITLGQEFGAWGKTIKKMIDLIADAESDLRELGIGGTAAGTGLNTHPDYAKTVIKHLNQNTNLGVANAEDLIESTQSQHQIQSFASALKTTAIEVSRIASDLRLLSSGPNTGLAELTLPAVQPGSSIMPGKINPSILECVNMVCARVIGAEATVSQCTLGGQLDLNVYMPLMSAELLHAMKILGNAAEMMADKCVNGITANKEQCKKYAYKSASLATALNPILGYDKVAEVVKEFVKTGKPIPEIILEKKWLSKEELEQMLDPEKMTKPGIAKRQ